MAGHFGDTQRPPQVTQTSATHASASSTATYWTVQDPSGTKLGQLVQETEEAVAEAVESEAEAVTETKKGLWSWLLG